MTLRLVLVSLVAAMGLTIPSTPVIESWVASTQNWMNARFADWDTRNPQTADYVIVSDFYDMERLAPRPARSSLPATAPEPSARPGPPNASSAAFSSKPALLQDTRSAAVRPVSFVREEEVVRADLGWREAQSGHRLRTQSQERGDRRGAATGGPETGRDRSVRPHPRGQKGLSRGPARAGSVEQDVGFCAPPGGLPGILTPAIRADRRGQESPWRRR